MQRAMAPGLLRLCRTGTEPDTTFRLCNPFITTTILEDTFGELAAEVAAKYLTEYEKGRYRLKVEYAR
jgi:hypothetical protein